MRSRQRSGTCAILLNSEGKVLVGKRKNGYKAGFYGLPGGMVEADESTEHAIKRELKEETGIEVVTVEYLGEVRENQGDSDFIHHVFVVKDVTQKPLLMEPEKCEGWIWVDLDEMENVLPGHQMAVVLLKKNS